MKNIFTILFLLACFSITAQDLIQKNNGEEISCKVIEITPELVKFKKTAITDSPIYSMYKSDVHMITFSDGYKEIFEHSNEDNPDAESNFFIDNRDSTKYQTVKIGKQVWFAENLSYETENSWCYKNKPNFCEKFGRLYTYEDALEACPDGWHLSSDEEWKELEIHLGMFDKVDEFGWRGNTPGQGRLLKNGGGSGFNAEFGGGRIDKAFWNVEVEAYFWTSSQYKQYKDYAWIRLLNARASIKREYKAINDGLSVRCIKDK